MAGKGGRSFSDLKMDLLKEGHAFSFFQAVRLLRFFQAPSQDVNLSHPEAPDHISIRPKLSLAFPPADIDRVEEITTEDGGRRFLITATLLGLYGASSPLPTFYTEDLMDEAGDEESVSRDFIDIINHRLFLLLFESWAKYRQFMQVVEEKNDDNLVRLFSLLGLGEKPLREDITDAYGLIRYIGLLTQFPRSAVGLRCLLQDALGDISVNVVSCVKTKARIPEDQRCSMGMTGCTLGSDSYVGEEIDDRMGMFRLQVGPINSQQFQSLLPGGKDRERLKFLTKFYVTDPLEYDMELILAEGEAQPVSLGRLEWSRLGWDTWIFSGDLLQEASVRSCPGQ